MLQHCCLIAQSHSLTPTLVSQSIIHQTMAACWLSLLICSSLSLQTAGQTTEVFGTVEVKGEYVPKARQYPSMVLYKKRLWTFGGFFLGNTAKNVKDETLGDLNCFDIDSKTWIKVAADGAPEGRAAHGTVVDFAGTMWLWGGATPQGGSASFHTAVYSVNLNELDLHPRDGKSSGAWQKVDVKGTAPPSRWQFSAVMNGTGMVIFAGGGEKPSDWFADVHYLDFEKKMWSEIKCQGDVPPARAGQSAALTSSGEMWVYGGRGKDLKTLDDLFYLKLDTKTWVKVAAKAVSPGPLFQHSLVMDAAGRMWLAGGGDLLESEVGGVAPNDKVFYIDTTSANAEWKEAEEFRGAVQRLAAPAAIETNGRMWCYGGAVKKPGTDPEALATMVWLDTNQPTPSTATTSAHPLDPAAQSGCVGVGTIIVILLVVAAIAAGAFFFLRRRREMRLLQEVQEPRQIELGPRV